MKKNLILLVLFLYCFNSLKSQYSTTGTDFWLAFMQNFDDPANTILYITSDVASSGTVSIPGTGWSTNFSVAANGTATVTIPDTQDAAISTNNSVVNKAVRVTSNNAVAVYAANQRSASSDATLVLPVHALGDTYRIMAYNTFTSDQPSMFAVVGIQNNTSIEIIPTAAVQGGSGANVPFTITLNQGQIYLVKSTGDLTGTIVRATTTGQCNDFAVFAGNRCAKVPTSCDYCDHLYEQMIPIKAWGKQYVTVPLMTRNGDVFRILASENNTQVSINNGAPINLNAGQFHETMQTGACFISANNPICVAQYSRGTSCDGVTSDPFMIILSPIEQTLNYIVFQAFNTTAINQFYTNIVTETAYTSQVQLNGAAITGWQTIPSNTQYSYVRKNIPQGSHVLTSPHGVLASVYGFGNVESYGYLAGANIQPLYVSFDIIIDGNPIPYDVFQDTLNCEQSANGVGFSTSGENITNIWFDFGDGNTATGTNVFHTYQNPGVYTVTMHFRRVGSCVDETLSMQVPISNSLPPFDFINDTIVCNGSPFVINPNVTGVNFLWQNGSTAPTFTANATGTYSLTISDNYGCSASRSAFVKFVNLSVNISAQELSCSGVNDGGLTAYPVGGDPAYAYYWNTSPPSFTQTVNNLGVGTYSVTVTDGNGCTSSSSYSLTMPPALNVTVSSTTSPLCFGQNNGSAVLSVNGGTAPFIVNWNKPGVSGLNPSNLGPGTYTFTVTDANGCYGTGNFTISEPAELTYQTSQLNAACYGQPISATVTPIGGTPPITITWQDGSTSFTNTNIPANTNFGFTITDSHNCSKTGSVYLLSPPELTITSTYSNIRCKGENNGSISITVQGGIPPYSALWNTGHTGLSYTNLSPGDYYVTVIDHNSCTLASHFNIREASQYLRLNVTTRNVTCSGYKDGAILLLASGGVSPYTYSITDGINTFNGQSNNGVPAGEFIASVTDNYGCTVDTTVIISEPAPLTALVGYLDPSCMGNNDGLIRVYPSGGTEPYIFIIGGYVIDEGLLAGLYQGEYTIIVKDSSNCEFNYGKVELVDPFIECIKIPNAFTPNSDGINDTWIIEGLEIFPGYILYVYNRWGQLLYRGEEGDEPWDGKYDGKALPAGSYVYVLDLRNGMKVYKGVVTIVY
jgi:gliding motility-associated-like protein